MSKSKNDIAWEKIFEKYCILDKLANNERISISSTEINQFREARLMTKFDHRSQLPKLFIDHNLSILPTSRGTYEIGKFKTFCDFNKDDIEITPIDFPTFFGLHFIKSYLTASQRKTLKFARLPTRYLYFSNNSLKVYSSIG